MAVQLVTRLAFVSVLHSLKETVEVSGLFPRVQFFERICEQIVGVSIPQVTKQFVARLATGPVSGILQETVRHHRVMRANWNVQCSYSACFLFPRWRRNDSSDTCVAGVTTSDGPALVMLASPRTKGNLGMETHARWSPLLVALDLFVGRSGGLFMFSDCFFSDLCCCLCRCLSRCIYSCFFFICVILSFFQFLPCAF